MILRGRCNYTHSSALLKIGFPTIMRAGSKIMEAITQEIDAEQLLSIFAIPAEMRNRLVEVTIRPVAETLKQERLTTMEKILQFREKYHNETFKEHLRKTAAEGFHFDFNAQNIISGTETEEEKQNRYRSEKLAWGKAIQDRIGRGEL
jgi:hypothetical protein